MQVRLRRIGWRRGVTVFTALLGLSGSRLASAQMDGGSEPAMAMGAGRGVQGTVTAVAADHLTLKTERGEAYQVALSANTRLIKGRAPIKLADVHLGDGIGAMGELDAPNRTVHALYIVVVGAEQLRSAREALGKTWISGTVTAIDETRLTILRPDQVSQVIAVDEDTSFRRRGRGMPMGMGGMLGGGDRVGGGPSPSAQEGGESVTLGDVKVGNMVAGTGTLKAGIFVPTVLGISDPAAGRGRRGPGASGNPKPSGSSIPAPEPKVR